VRELGQRISLAELAEWLAYDRLAQKRDRINDDGSAKPLFGGND